MQPNNEMNKALELVLNERLRQIELWGDQNDNKPFQWMSILGEEFGELCEAVNETYAHNPHHPERGGYQNIVKEATQVAAVAVAMIESMMVKNRRADNYELHNPALTGECDKCAFRSDGICDYYHTNTLNVGICRRNQDAVAEQ